jgi:hypothetical protein
MILSTVCLDHCHVLEVRNMKIFKNELVPTFVDFVVDYFPKTRIAQI